MTDISITQTQVIKDAQSPRRIGGLADRKRYIWRGSANAPVFLIQNTREASFDHIDVVCETPTDAVFLSERKKTGPGTIPPTMAQFRDVRVYGNGHASHGFFQRATIDENGEHHRFDCVSMYGCEVGWGFEGQQAKEHLLTQCRFESGRSAIASDTGFTWIGGTVAVCEVGIVLTRVGDPVLIQGVGFEACNRLLGTVGPSTDAQSITLVGCRFAADQLHADGAMIVMRHAGPLAIVGGAFGDGNQRCPQIHLAGIGDMACSVHGAKFGSFGADKVPVIRTNPGVRHAGDVSGCTYRRDASASENTATVLSA